MAFRPQTRRRLLVAGVAGCLTVVLIDLAAPGVTAPVRSAAATVFTPVQEVLSGGDETVRRLTKERDDARRALGDKTTNSTTLAAVRALRGSAAADGRTFVVAQVIGFTPGTTAGQMRQVTIDVGSADGIIDNLTVISAGGLVGRTVAVTAHSATVQLLTDPAAVVGVRAGDQGLLGTVSSTVPAGIPSRATGLLTLRVAGLTPVTKGDRVRTLGSIDETPFVRDVPVGTVLSVDPDRGQGAPTAVVRPDVDPSRLDVVGVVVPPDRVGQRPVVRGER